jgi:hypothetical protein
MSYNHECPTDAPFSNVVTVEKREIVDGELVVTLRQTLRTWINGRNSTVNFRTETQGPTRGQALERALAEGAITPEAERDYTGVFVEPMQGGGFMASIEQLDYVYPMSVHELRFANPGEAEDMTDQQLIAMARANGAIAGELSA